MRDVYVCADACIASSLVVIVSSWYAGVVRQVRFVRCGAVGGEGEVRCSGWTKNNKTKRAQTNAGDDDVGTERTNATNASTATQPC